MFVMLIGTASAMAQESSRIGGQLLYSGSLDTPGLGLVAEFPVAPKFVIAPSFSYYFPKGDSFLRQTAWELNGNLNYHFVTNDQLEFYGLGGINYTNVGAKFDGSSIGIGNISTNAGELGINLGLGANFNIGKNFLPFGELKYIFGDFDRVVIAAGIKFNL